MTIKILVTLFMGICAGGAIGYVMGYNKGGR